MLRTAFISNLHYDASDDDLRDLLEEYSPTYVRVVTDKETGKSRGFAFAEFNDEENFETCMHMLNGSHFKGRVMFVKEALPKKKVQL